MHASTGRVGRARSGWVLLAAGALLAGLMVGTQAEATGTITRLAPMPATGDVERVVIGPNDDYALFLADATTDGRTDVYSIRLEQGAVPVRLSEGPGGVPIDVDQAGFSPDGTRVAFTGSIVQLGPVDHAIWTVPVDGPATSAVRVSAPSTSIDEVHSFRFSPDGTRLVYRWLDLNNSGGRIVSVPVDGPVSQAVSLSSGSQFHYEVSNTDVVYSSAGIQRVPIDGPSSSAVQIAPRTDDEYINSWAFSPDYEHIAYTANEIFDDPTDLFVVPTDGPRGAAVQLTTLPEDYQSVTRFRFSPDGSRVIFTVFNTYALWSVPAAGPAAAAVELTGGVAGADDVETFGPFFLPSDAQSVLFLAESASSNQQLFQVPLAGPATSAVRVSHDLPPDQGVAWATLSSTDQVAYQVDDQWEEFANMGRAIQIWGIPGDGGSGVPVQLSSPPAGGTLVASDYGGFSMEFLEDGSTLLFTGVQDDVEVMDLFRVPATGPASAREQMTEGLAPNGDVQGFDGTSDGAIVVYIADQITDGVFELFANGTLPEPGPDPDPDPSPNNGVSRLAGADRFETAAAVSAATFGPGVPVAFVAVGSNYPDALAGGPAGGVEGGPILLARTDSLPAATVAELTRLAPREIVILGGAGVITPTVEAALADYVN